MGGGAGAIIGIQRRRHQAQRGEPAGHIPHITHLDRRERAAEQRLLAIREELLQHLVAADGEAPDRFGNVTPIRVLVEEHVVGASAQ